MKHKSAGNFLADLPAAMPAEITQTLVEAGNLRIERIVSRGQASPENFWYDQAQSEWVMVVQGSARLRFDDEIVEMQAGDWVNIPAHKRHRVEWTTAEEPTVWLAVFYDLNA